MVQTFAVLSVLLVPHILITMYMKGEACLQTNTKYGMTTVQQELMANSNHDVIPYGNQAILPSYRFNCCGYITRWEVALHQLSVEQIYTVIELQVWRPIPTLNNTYSKVGGSLFNITSLCQTLVHRLFPKDCIQFLPGDVIGFHIWNLSEKPDKTDEAAVNNNGVVTLNKVKNIASNEEVWYAPKNDSVDGDSECLISMGLISVGENGMLSKFTNALPVISVSTHNNIIMTIQYNTQEGNVTHTCSAESTTTTVSSTQETSPVMHNESDTSWRMIVMSATIVSGFLITTCIIMLAIACTCLVVKSRGKNCISRRTSTLEEALDERRTDVLHVSQARRVAFSPTVLQLNIMMAQNNGMLVSNASLRQKRGGVESDETQVHKEDNIGDAPIIVRSNEAYGKLGNIVASAEYDYPNVL